VISVSDSRSRDPGFDSRPVYRQATLWASCTHVPLSPSSSIQFGTGQRAVMLCGREGNRRPAWRRTGHASQTLVVYPPTGSWPRKRDEHPTYAPYWSKVHFTFFSPEQYISKAINCTSEGNCRHSGVDR